MSLPALGDRTLVRLAGDEGRGELLATFPVEVQRAIVDDVVKEADEDNWHGWTVVAGVEYEWMVSAEAG